MKAGRILVVFVVLALALVPLMVLAEDYQPGEDATLYAEVKDGSGTPVTTANVTIDLRASDGTFIVNNQAMVHVADGVYRYDLTMPATEGTYFATADAGVYGIASEVVHVVSSNVSIGSLNITGSAIWGENVTGYTDINTFGGMLADALGGNIMFLIGLIVLAVVILAAYFVKHHVLAGVIGGGTLFVAGVQAYTMSSSTWDVYFGFAFLAMIAGVMVAVYALTAWNRERPEPEDIDTDEVTGEPKVESEKVTHKRGRGLISRFKDTGEL